MPRAGLNRQRVVDEAATIADEVGLGALTLAAVASRCGVALPSLYKHVSGLDGVHRDLAILGITELHERLSAAAVGRSGSEAFHALAAAYRTYAKERPGVYAASIRAPAGADDEHNAASDRVLSVLVAVLAGYGIKGGDTVDAIRIFRASLHGFVSLEAAGGFGMPRSVDATFRRLVDALDTALTSWSTT